MVSSTFLINIIYIIKIRKENSRGDGRGVCMYDLLPCPLCGKKAELKERNKQGCFQVRVKCTSCGLKQSWYKDSYRNYALADAVNDWNTRVVSTKHISMLPY